MEDDVANAKASVSPGKGLQSADTGLITSNDDASDSDGASIASTSDLFAAPAPESPLDPGPTTRELGLTINGQHGWSGSQYDDYE